MCAWTLRALAVLLGLHRRGGRFHAVLDLAFDLADLVGVRLEVEGTAPLELGLRLAADPPIGIAQMVVQHRVLRLQLHGALEIADRLVEDGAHFFGAHTHRALAGLRGGEFKEQSERKEYLDRQCKDLTDALETLESAMRKIDRETRTRFQDTFDKVNAGLKEKFPRLFGGGHAYLELTGEEGAAAGVSVMARPPGKRNSTISQLSGGEKALTAVALVFAIFDLNPAPFCLLDEVDAPLDENNVGRFCDIVRDMSRNVQFIFITHNKSTMELASQLVGVTMNEPGVSRLVAVDVDEAVRMAAM